VLYWDRRGLNEESNFKTFAFKERMEDTTFKAFKFSAMLRFRQFAKAKIKEGKYDLLVILTTLPAVLLSRFLIEVYPNRFVVDIRDYTYEKYSFYQSILKSTLDKAVMRVVSSPGFKHFLPMHDYTVCHNLSIPIDGNRNIRVKNPRSNSVINISYIGAISYFNEVTKLLNILANDHRYFISFFGSGADECKLKEYCVTSSIENTYFHGIYQPTEKENFYGGTDLIFNAYGNESLNVKYSLSNKLYDAAWYCIPILVSPLTEMSKMAGYLGYELDYTKHAIADELYIWYNELVDWNKLEINSRNFIEKAFDDNKKFETKLLDLIVSGRAFK